MLVGKTIINVAGSYWLATKAKKLKYNPIIKAIVRPKMAAKIVEITGIGNTRPKGKRLLGTFERRFS